MATPLRKDQPDFDNPELKDKDERLTTADIAEGSRPETEKAGPRPVSSERNIDRGARFGQGTNIEQGTDIERGGKFERDTGDTNAARLFPSSEMESLRTRWKEIQTAFVDEPRNAVEQADGLVASAMKRLAEVFSEERSRLEGQWDRGDSVSTEDLRVALQKYRTFFERMLSV